jgi:hypothetical protein
MRRQDESVAIVQEEQRVGVRWLGMRWAAGALVAVWLGAGGIAGAHGAAVAEEHWVHIDTASSTLRIKRGEDVVLEMPDIAIGRGGASRERFLGDYRTPLGEFRIAAVKDPAYYRRFFIIDYPNLERAQVALERNEIDEQTFEAIRRASSNGRLPPQNTPLGGNLGIHGLGPADRRVHELFNWTRGCVAVTNEQIDELSRWIRVGTRVVID